VAENECDKVNGKLFGDFTPKSEEASQLVNLFVKQKFYETNFNLDQTKIS
jgi:hypothetical protein